jgi:hypothetical protein
MNIGTESKGASWPNLPLIIMRSENDRVTCDVRGEQPPERKKSDNVNRISRRAQDGW